MAAARNGSPPFSFVGVVDRVDSLASRELTLSGWPVYVARLPPAPFCP